MRAVRFGSYSMWATFAGTPSLSTRLKSTRRYWRLCPPPWCRAVTLPWTFRPPLLDSGASSDFSGVDRVISAKSETLAPRRPGVIGLYLRIGMSIPSADRAAEGLDPVTVGELDHRPLRVLALAPAGSGALALALAVERVDGQHADVEDLLNRDLDLRLVRVRMHQERVPVVVQLAVALLRNHRRDDDVPRVGNRGHFSPSSASAASSSASSASAAASSAAAIASATSPVTSGT